jgi:hypothetical protein
MPSRAHKEFFGNHNGGEMGAAASFRREELRDEQVAYSSSRWMPADAVEQQISPLRYAPVEMTRAGLRWD